MKISTFLKDPGGTAECTKRLMMATKVCGQLTSNDTYFDDIWFSVVQTDDEVITEGVDYCGPVKASHKVFFYQHYKSW